MTLAQQSALSNRLLAIPLGTMQMIAGVPVLHSARQVWQIGGIWSRTQGDARRQLERMVGRTRLYPG